jgi:hypothetical protein
MKFSAAALLLLGAAANASSVDANQHTTGWKYDDQKDPHERMLQGKKGGSAGGKKGDCTDGAMVISDCNTFLGSGRYVLDRNLNCGLGEFGIAILDDDVHLDCQGNKIRGRGPFGIGVSDAEDITVSNCDVSGFFNGLQADTSGGFWTDLTVRDSSFTNNIRAGMDLEGDFLNPSEVTVVSSKFNENGNENALEGVGVVSTNVEGTFYSSTMNDNNGFVTAGFVAFGSGERTLVDVTASGNFGGPGIAGGVIPTVNVINSIACMNFLDMLFVETAQANTCDSSMPPDANSFKVCQCTCDGGPSVPTAESSTVEDEDGPFAWVYSEQNPFAIRANETVAAILNL